MMSKSHSGMGSSVTDDSSSVAGEGSGEIMLFGVRVNVDPMRKSVSMNDLSQYVQPASTHDSSSNSNNHDVSAAVAADIGYASADDAVRNQSNGCRERKRGVPWTEEEHKLFLLGLQKVGKGDWRGISRNFVKSRTPTQVASHAQKYFLRRSNLNRRRRRSSLFDITTDLVAAVPMEEEQVQDDNNGHSVPSSQQISPLSGFPILSPAQMENQKEAVSSNNGGSSSLIRPIPLLPTPNPSTKTDLFSNQKHETDPLPLSLNLSLSCDHNRSSQRRSSAFQVISGFNNGGSSSLIRPIPLLPKPNPSTRTDLFSNQKQETDPLPLSLNLSLSCDHNRSSQRRSSAFQAISGFNNGDGRIIVA